MKVSELDYTFPKELIAQNPMAKRGASRMMMVRRSQKDCSHDLFSEFPSHFKKGDLIVLNDSKVLPCRLIGRKKTGGRVEFLLVRQDDQPIVGAGLRPALEKFSVWSCLVKNGKGIKKGDRFEFSENFSGILLDDEGPERRIELHYDGDFFSLLKKVGHVPLPPYINRNDLPSDHERYQTIYARNPGSVAAPTAGFHFTEEILGELEVKGVQIAKVTLHVGIGTFLPIRTETVEAHTMHAEHFDIPEKTANLICKTKKEGGKVTAVGTTTVRALESAWDPAHGVRSGRGYTEKFIYPPCTFNVVNHLLTNFHQPKSTLLALVMSFGGEELIREAYREAIAHKYRLFSYGDCMLIV